MGKAMFIKRQGFTLVEILVAMALLMTLTIGLVGLGQLSVRASMTSRLRVKAMAVLQGTMEAAMAVRASNFGSLTEGTYYPVISEGKWSLEDGTEMVGTVERWVEVYKIQREVSCGGERICPIVESGGVVDPVTFRAKAVVVWDDRGEEQREELESLLTFWR